MKSVRQNDGERKGIFCAIDLHDKSMLAGVCVGRGKIGHHLFNTREDQGFLELIETLNDLSSLYPGAGVYVAYEASGSGFRLADVLMDEGFETSVLAPSHLPVSQRSRSQKTDKKDVKRIMDVLRGHVLAGGDLPAVWIPPAELRDHREVVRRRVSLGEDVTRIKNKIHGLLKRNGIRKPEGMDNWTQAHLAWLDEVSLQAPAGCGFTLGGLLRELAFYQEETKLVDGEVARLSCGECYHAKVEALTNLKGVGVLTAMVFLTELGDLDRFPNRRALGSYLGLTPRSYESGEDDDRKGHISRMGPSRLRKLLNQAAWAVVKWDDGWRSWFLARTEIEGLSAKKKKELRKKMIVAVMRRLGIWLWHQGQNACAC
jgi:transposase